MAEVEKFKPNTFLTADSLNKLVTTINELQLKVTRLELEIRDLQPAIDNSSPAKLIFTPMKAFFIQGNENIYQYKVELYKGEEISDVTNECFVEIDNLDIVTIDEKNKTITILGGGTANVTVEYERTVKKYTLELMPHLKPNSKSYYQKLCSKVSLREGNEAIGCEKQVLHYDGSDSKKNYLVQGKEKLRFEGSAVFFEIFQQYIPLRQLLGEAGHQGQGGLVKTLLLVLCNQRMPSTLTIDTPEKIMSPIINTIAEGRGNNELAEVLIVSEGDLQELRVTGPPIIGIGRI